jgi:hypothetical protein
VPLLARDGIQAPPDNATLWRYADLATVAGLFRTKRLRLSRLDSFPDKWEGLVRRVTKGPLRSANSEDFVGGYSYLHGDTQSPDRARATALCWCRSEFDNAALWERFGRDNLGIALKTTVGWLRRMLDGSTLDLLFGNVRYIATLDRDEPGTNAPDTFFVKDRSY